MSIWVMMCDFYKLEKESITENNKQAQEAGTIILNYLLRILGFNHFTSSRNLQFIII